MKQVSTTASCMSVISHLRKVYAFTKRMILPRPLDIDWNTRKDRAEQLKERIEDAEYDDEPPADGEALRDVVSSEDATVEGEDGILYGRIGTSVHNIYGVPVLELSCQLRESVCHSKEDGNGCES